MCRMSQPWVPRITRAPWARAMAWIETGHQWAGLGSFPDAPVAGYLARSASLMYGLHGLLLFLLATDTVLYRKLIRWIAGMTVLHGGFMLTIDVVEHMPLWWTIVEGPAFSLTGIVILVAQRYPRTIRNVGG